LHFFGQLLTAEEGTATYRLGGLRSERPVHPAERRQLHHSADVRLAIPHRGTIRAVHRSRDERAWWRQTGIDPIKIARSLWKGDARDGTAAVSTTGITSAAWRRRAL
jgi:hypothetical protein